MSVVTKCCVICILYGYNDGDCSNIEFTVYDNMEDVPLGITGVDPCLDKNGENHRTSRFEMMNRHKMNTGNPVLVVRRGQPFHLKVYCDRPYDEEKDVISFMLSVHPMDGERVSHGHGTVVHLPLQKADDDADEDESDWRAVLETQEDEVLTISIRPSARASVSKWNLAIDTKQVGFDQVINANVSVDFYLLFNPWCENDYVYLEGMYNVLPRPLLSPLNL